MRNILIGLSEHYKDGESISGPATGTLAYMSPEMIVGEPYDRQCDIWSLGVIVYNIKRLFYSKDKHCNVRFEKEKRIIINPATILNSLEKNNKILPIVDAAMPRAINTNEKPNENNIVLISTFLLSFSISSNFFPVI